MQLPSSLWGKPAGAPVEEPPQATVTRCQGEDKAMEMPGRGKEATLKILNFREPSQPSWQKWHEVWSVPNRQPPGELPLGSHPRPPLTQQEKRATLDAAEGQAGADIPFKRDSTQQRK